MGYFTHYFYALWIFMIIKSIMLTCLTKNKMLTSLAPKQHGLMCFIILFWWKPFFKHMMIKSTGACFYLNRYNHFTSICKTFPPSVDVTQQGNRCEHTRPELTHTHTLRGLLFQIHIQSPPQQNLFPSTSLRPSVSLSVFVVAFLLGSRLQCVWPRCTPGSH